METTFFDRIRMIGSAAANPQSVVECGAARFTILTARLIRLEWGALEDRATFAFPNRFADAPAYSVERHDDGVEISTEALTLRYRDDGQPFHADNLSIQFDLNGQHVEWKPGTSNLGNLRGTCRTLDQCAGAANLQEGLIAREGWSLFDDSQSVLWDSEGLWVEPRRDAPVQDWYFFGYGHDYKAALAEYMHFGGPIPLIPRYVLGGWWSRFWAYRDQDLMVLVEAFNAHDIPLDVLVIDMDWHTPVAWTGYSWNRQLFRDPVAFLTWVHDQGLYATLNLHPAQGVQTHEDAYPEFARRLGHPTDSGIEFSPTDKAFMQQYFELLHHPMEEQGVDFWWLDWQQGEISAIKGLDPLMWLNHLHFRDSARRGKRSMLYSRWGGLGNHRYPIGFSGDTYATWESLRFQTYFTPTAANVAYGWWSHDIGGHFWATDPELYARWVQFGAVSPCLRLHSTKDPLAERRPWAFPAPVYEAAKAAFQLRYQLLPYLYSAARSAAQTGLSLSLPMYYDYPEAEDAYLAREQYFLGDQMIAAPVVRPADPATGLAVVDVWLPEGTWIDYTTLASYHGPHWIRQQVDLARIPMFVRAGAILPLAPKIARTKEFDGSHLIVTVFPVADGRFDLYEDDGLSSAYTRGDYEITSICSALLDDDTLRIQFDAAQGECAALPDQRSIDLRVRGLRPPTRVEVDGAAVSDWSYDPAACALTIPLGARPRSAPISILISAEDVRSVARPDPDKNEVSLAAPFVHVVDYATYDDARGSLSVLVLVPREAALPFDAEIEWEMEREGLISMQTVTLKNCTERQIVPCPFADDGRLNACRWRATVTLTGQGEPLRFVAQSPTAYPTINRWRKLVSDQALTLGEVLTPDGGLNPDLRWTVVAQRQGDAPNLRQPYGVILEDQASEACLATTIFSPAAQDVILHLQAVGAARASLNGVDLRACNPVDQVAAQPMFPSWMTPTHVYYDLPLKAGANTLVLLTQPDSASGRWGVGATLLDRSGEILLNNGEV